MIEYLKVKLKSLATESKIIKKEEQRAIAGIKKYSNIKDPRRKHFCNLHHGLYNHRKGVVSQEARRANIAYGLLRGKGYDEIERKCKKTLSHYDVLRIYTLVRKYRRKNSVLSEEILKAMDNDNYGPFNSYFREWMGLDEKYELRLEKY